MDINIHDAKTQFSALLKRVEKGEEVIISNRGKRVARLVSYEPPQRPSVMSLMGCMKDEIKLHEGWDAGLSDADMIEFEKGNLG
ncbi:type II toxin-antitoxin system prevent-host-death family antitoxin [Kushneria sp. AK178]